MISYIYPSKLCLTSIGEKLSKNARYLVLQTLSWVNSDAIIKAR